MEKISNEEARARLMETLSEHVGKENAIGMDELYERVFGKKVRHKINDTRDLRKLITTQRLKGIPIGSTSSQTGGGYYLVRAGSELEEYCSRILSSSRRGLLLVSRLKKLALPKIVGQLEMELQERRDDAA